MREKQLHRTLDKRGEKLAGLIRRIGAGFDMDDIHVFRTTLKKWRALLRAFSTSKHPLTRSFKRLIHLSGELRNLQVLLSDSGTNDGRLAEFKKWLNACLIVQQDAWKRIYHPRIVETQLKKTARQDFKKSGRRGIDQFCRMRINRIKGILCLPSPSHDELHGARKMIKDMQYVNEWAAKEHPDRGYSEKLPPLKRIARQAGDFNDQRIALDLLNTYLQKNGPSGLNEEIAAIRQEWEEGVSKKKKTLLNALKRYIRTALEGQ